MKTKSFYLALILLSFISWSCTNKDDVSQASLKTSISKNVQELTSTLDGIKASAGYQVLATPGSPSGVSMSKVYSPVIDSTFNSIVLADIMGEYDYNKSSNYKKWKFSLLNFFSKTADNATQMIVRLPEEKVKKPWTLTRYVAADTLLTNNYVLALNDYQYSFNRFLGWDYTMASTINIKNVDAGALKIKSSNSRAAGYKFNSEFAFANGSVAKCDYSTGDTAVATYAITNGTKTVYEEKYTAIKAATNSRHRENYYALTIGDVQIIRNSGINSLDSAKVYVAGVLQLKSKVEIVDVATDSVEVSVTNHKRELKITFDDGTSSTISSLLGTSVTTIRDLFVALRQTYFTANVVDVIAWDIYINKK
jgi:hypothetical protein